jgi:hypothetical protein
VLPPVHLRAAIAEASAQSLPIHTLGSRSGAAEAAGEFDALLGRILPAGVPDDLRPATFASPPSAG